MAKEFPMEIQLLQLQFQPKAAIKPPDPRQLHRL
jgi:hypothetical protein